MEERIIVGYIYKITNIVNNFVYIGKTTYKDIQKRFIQHLSYAESGGGSEKTIHQAIRDFGKDAFIIEKIETVYAPDFLEEAEKRQIKKYHSWIGDPECKGYNQSRGGEGTHYSSNDFSDYLAEKIISSYEKTQNQRETAKELEIDPTTVRNYLAINGIKTLSSKDIAIKNTGKKVAIYNKDKLIAIYPSLGEAAKHFIDKEQASHISEVCYGKRTNVKGYTAKFTEEKVFNQDFMIPTINNVPKNKKKQVQMLDMNTKKVLKTFESGCEVGRYFEMPTPSQATTCIKKAIDRDGTWRGYKWNRIE